VLGAAPQTLLGGVLESLRVWTPLAVWLGFIALASGTVGAQENSDAWLRAFLSSWFPGLFEDVEATGFRVLSFLLRKASHLFVYAVLGLTATWALCLRSGDSGREERGRIPAVVLLLGAVVALADESHQWALAFRTGSLGDALLDVLGVGLGSRLASHLWRPPCGQRTAEHRLLHHKPPTLLV